MPLDPLERGQLNVMRLRAALNAVPLLIGAGVLEYTALPQAREAFGLPPFGLMSALVLALALWMVLTVRRRWQRWGYAFTGGELHVGRGWLTRVHTIVPVLRVQHIDVTQGPIERLFGVSRLVLHTAGTDNSQVELPGIARATAEHIRDAIRARIGSVE